MSDTTRLQISGVRSRVALRVARRRDSRVTLEQKLPFLAIGTEVADERGQTGRIERVGVALEGGVPKIVLELAYDVLPQRASIPPGVRRDQTIGYDQRPSAPPPAAAPASTPPPAALAPLESTGKTVAFPLETRRRARLPESWLGRLFAPLTAWLSARPE